ncbi:MAG: hypothetical protein NTV55_10550 [Planctomycetota bacterium]|nr:hypothetical protein [Planctomycetota bacterium]
MGRARGKRDIVWSVDADRAKITGSLDIDQPPTAEQMNAPLGKQLVVAFDNVTFIIAHACNLLG